MDAISQSWVDPLRRRSTAKRRRIRAGAAMLTVAIVVGACGSAMASPTPTSGPTYTPWPTYSAWPTYTPWPTLNPTPSPTLTPTPWPTDTPWPTLEPTPSPTLKPTPGPTRTPTPEFATDMGTAPLAAPADDYGARAGREINDFGVDLLRQLDSSGNLCASPTSIALALAMVRAGAKGQTATEMDKVLHDFGTTGGAGELVALIQELQAQTTYDDSDFESDDPDATPDETGKTPLQELDVSNAVFSQKGMSLEQPFLDSLSSSFGAGVGLVDYEKDPEAARQIINQWASERTKGRIPEILRPGDVDTDTRIALANAIYLKAPWTHPFDPDATNSLPFTRADGSKVSVPTMAMDSWLQYAAGKGYRAVDLPLGGDGSSLSMTIIVPDDMSSFVKSLTAAQLAGIESQVSTYDVDLTLPRFSADTRFDLSDILAAMGMPTAFNPNTADFSGITTDVPLYIQSVIHQANIDVVETGVTAAAVTVVVMGGGSAAPEMPPHVQFHINKPFLYFITDGLSGAILFMGRIDDPSASS